MIKELNTHYSFTNPATVHDEEALTALELAGRTTAKVNEVVKSQNQLVETMEKEREEVIPTTIAREVNDHIQKGTFDNQIDEHTQELLDQIEETESDLANQYRVLEQSLGTRVDNLLGSVTAGSTSMDAEVIDGRVGSDGTTHTNVGNAIRNALAMGGLVEDTNYTTKMPDANAVLTPNVYVLHFADGTSNIPAHLPFEKWQGRIGLLFVFKGSYYRQIFMDDHRIMTRNGTRVDNWSEWRALTKPEYVVDLNGNGDFSSILKGLKAHPTNTRFIVKQGVYNVVDMYRNVYGAGYFDAYTGYAGSADDMDKGLFLGEGVELIADGYVELLFNYTGSNQNVKQYFSILSTSQNNVVDGINITIVDGSCRYLIHDDYATAEGSNVFRNMTLKGYSNLGTAIGGGFGIYNTYLIENCVFTDSQESIAIAYHNNGADAKNTLRIVNCKCEGSIYLKHYGASEQKSTAYVSGCEYKKLVLTHGDQTNFPNENIKLVEWNNNVGVSLTQLSSEIVELQNGTSIKQNAITADKIAFIQNNLVYAESKVEFQANKGATWASKSVEFDVDLNVVDILYFYIGANNSIASTIAQIYLYNGDTLVKTMNYESTHSGTWRGTDTNGQGATRCKLTFRGSLDNAFTENTNVFYNDVKVIKGTTEISYQFDENIKFSEHQIVYDEEVITLTVKADGTGDYTNPVDACNATFPNLYGNKKYIIEVHEGEYDVYSAWTDFNKTGMYITGNNVGINLGKNVSLVGVGARESVILKCNQPNDTAWSIKGSCINMNLGGNTLENLTLIAENSRYTVHSDNSNTYKDMNYLVKNCVLIHNDNASGLWEYPTCWGEGCSSGDMRVFENCTFISPRDAFGFHNNVNYDKPSRHIVRECIIKTTGNNNAINLISMGSGQRDVVELHNCIINGAVKLANDGVSSSDIHLVMTGCSNVEVIGATGGAEIDIA